MLKQPRVVIVGAGFGGLQVAQSLAGVNAEILLIDRNNYHTFVPLLYQVATAQIAPTWIAYPVRTKFRRFSARTLQSTPNVRFLMAEVTQINWSDRLVETDRTTVSYDYLVLATGSQTQFAGVPGAEDYALPLRSLDDAIAIRNRLLSCFEQAVQETDPVRRQQLLTFVIVGGGATGVEMAGALVELIQGAIQKDYPELKNWQSPDRVSFARIVLLQSGNDLLTEFPSTLRHYAYKQLQRLGVEVVLQTRVQAVTSTGVQLQNGDTIDAATVMWTAGQAAAVPGLSEPVTIATKQKLRVQPTLQLLEREEVYAIGDVAYMEQHSKPLAGVAPEALQQGVAVARNIRRQLQGKSPKPFQYFNKGRLAIIGCYSGVGQVGRVKLKGFLPWLLWLGVHWVYLPGFRNRLLILLTWLQGYLGSDRLVRIISPTRHYQSSSVYWPFPSHSKPPSRQSKNFLEE